MNMNNSDDLADKVILVTGSRRGIGRAIAESCCAAGAHVVVHSRDLEKAQQVAELLHQQGGAATSFVADLRRPDEIRQLFAHIRTELGRLDGLVNNAGIAIVKPSSQFSEEDWDQVFGVNVKGMFLCCQQAFTLMKEKNTGGQIVNISSAHAEMAVPNRAVYATSKAAVHHLTRCLAVEWAPYGIRVNAVAPGFVRTEQIAHLIEQHEPQLIRRTPLRRLAEPRDISEAVLFLLSDRARHITGEVLRVDGGWVPYGHWELPND
ncbi:MAG: SDR family NAD(P)-dependent oxidoreductase [Candidatus Bipolaricaulia bacterium]